jgi:peptidoglycan/xylan/chitin deacetylase (PgdA/CDA1 family)
MEIDPHVNVGRLDPGGDISTADSEGIPGADGPDGLPARASDGPPGSDGHEALILIYHRVAECESDPWSVCLSPRRFAEHLEVMRRHATPTRLRDLAGILRAGSAFDRNVVVTFDEGYVDNLNFAIPTLVRLGFPATIFVSTSFVGDTREMWWDELERIFLRPGTLPELVTFSVGPQTYEWTLGDSALYPPEVWREHLDWRYPQEPPTPRHSVVASLQDLFMPLQDASRQATLDELRAWAGIGRDGRPSHRLFTVAELNELDGTGLVEIGAHSVSYSSLADLSPDSMRESVLRSRSDLEAMLGHPPASFAYPLGDYTPEAAAAVEEAGFVCACAATQTYVGRASDPYRLPRVDAHKLTAEELERELLRWFA